VLRDNVSFTRAAYLEFDLEAMMAGEIYADFTLLWLAVHQSRVEGAPETCWLEKWSQEAAEQGTRALDSLRDGVQEAISILGRGFLAHPANGPCASNCRAAISAPRTITASFCAWSTALSSSSWPKTATCCW
jgi:hypothetical protein